MKPVVAGHESEKNVTDLREVRVENGLPSLMYSKRSKSLLEKINFESYGQMLVWARCFYSPKVTM